MTADSLGGERSASISVCAIFVVFCYPRRSKEGLISQTLGYLVR